MRGRAEPEAMAQMPAAAMMRLSDRDEYLYRVANPTLALSIWTWRFRISASSGGRCLKSSSSGMFLGGATTLESAFSMASGVTMPDRRLSSVESPPWLDGALEAAPAGAAFSPVSSPGMTPVNPAAAVSLYADSL